MEITWAAVVGDGGASRDRQAHLFGTYRAVIGPRGDARHGEWSWAVLRGHEDEPVAFGYAYDERDARRAVLEWAEPRVPRSWKRRLRALGRARH